ncbi:hypothetical protein AB0C34_20130 [Nocardia sp. NPDC049220]|uniref:hypothetical protein n=1 Tax=Nocardia sp. NPDC049220 TaxID=3155273 RepID=UPI0033E2C7E0
MAITWVILAILAVQGAIVGLWATVAPHSWYSSFPGFGTQWVAVDGPYNHHLAGDVGAFFLALTAVTIAALVVEGTTATRIAGIGWLTFGIPHFVYHAAHRPAALGATSFAVSLIGAFLLVVAGLFCVFAPPLGDVPRQSDSRFPGRRPRASR